MSVAADVVVIGAGISGLVDAILLAETGRRVIVLEHHKVPGGYLQQFRRNRTVFDVGFHYIGSTRPGRPMRQFLEHLQIWNRIDIIPFDEEAAIEVVSGSRRFAYPTRFARFREKALATWPHERDAIERLVADVNDVCSRFKWFDLRRGREYQHPRELELADGTLDDYLTPLIADPWLREVLGFQAVNLGLLSHEIPWVKHALAFRSNFDETCRIDGGGGALVAALVERGKELGVEYRFRSEAVSFRCEKRYVRSVRTQKGEEMDADLVVAACHPKPILRRLRDEDLHPMFKERVLQMKESRGALQVFVVLREPLRSLGASCVLLRETEERAKEPPIDTVLITYPTSVECAARGAPRLEALTYVEYAPFARWANTRVLQRGPEYERFKSELVERLIRMISKLVPELRDQIAEVYASTPLTSEWYTKNEEGAIFGISHDVSQQGMDRPQTRTRLKNLYFTGHSITMPGICGVFINAFDTCAMIRGDDGLFENVAT